MEETRSALAGDFPFKFGDIETADVVLRLEPIEGEEFALLHLHSHVLLQSEYFRARLSERWASSNDKNPLQLTLDKCKNLQVYVRCMELMYVPKKSLRRSLGSVEEAVGVLEVAAQLLFDACITACMHYLEIVAWSIEEEELIRSCISTFHLTPTPGLADKLSIPDNPVDMMKNIIFRLYRYGFRDLAERMMIDNIQPIFFPTFGTVNDVILMEEFRFITEKLINDLPYGVLGDDEDVLPDLASRLEWIFNQLDKSQVAEEVFKMLADDQEVVDGITSAVGSSFVNQMFETLQNEKVMVSTAVRVALLRKWLPLIARHFYELLNGELLCNVVQSLPMMNQEMIFKVCIESWCKVYGVTQEDAMSSWILDQFDEFEVAERAFEVFADEEEVDRQRRRIKYSPVSVSSFANRIFGALQSGKVMVSIAVRVALLSKWLPIIAQLDCKLLKVELFCNAVKSLPMKNQEMIYEVWIKSCCKPQILEEAFDCWGGKLRRTSKDDNAEPSTRRKLKRARKDHNAEPTTRRRLRRTRKDHNAGPSTRRKLRKVVELFMKLRNAEPM